MLPAGTPAPPFTLPDQHARPVRVPDDFDGAWILLWWYPKAATPG